MNKRGIKTGLVAADKGDGYTSVSVASRRWLRSQQFRACLIITLFSTLVTSWLVASCAGIELTYLSNFGYFYDPAAYYQWNIDLYRLYQQKGLSAALWQEIAFNWRFPARTILNLLLAPDQLATNLGHLWSEVPFIWLFIQLFCCTVYSRTKSLFFAIASTSLISGVRYLYDPMNGIAAYWLDSTSAFALGSAALCLISFVSTRNRLWLLAFGLLASAATLCRYSAGFYVLAFASLTVPAALMSTGKLRWKSAIADLTSCLVGAAPGLVFLIVYLERNRSYYSVYGYAFGAPISESISFTASAVTDLLGAPTITILLILTAANLLVLCLRRARDWRTPFISLWCPVSIFLFVCFVVKAVQGWHCLVYFVPAIFVAAFGPIDELRPNRIWWRGLAIALSVTAVTTTAYWYGTFRQLARTPPASIVLNQRANSAMTHYIVETKARRFIQFNTESLEPQLESFLNHGVYCEWPNRLFSIHEAYMKNYFVNETPDKMSKSVYERLKADVPLVAVFAVPAEAAEPGIFDNPYSSTVAREVSYMVSHEAAWRRLGEIDSPQGRLAVYWYADER